MKKLTLIFLYFFLCFSLSLFAQENKYGLKEISRADRLKIENSPKIVGEEWNASEHGKVVKTLLELPKYIDHSRSKYFPTIIRQIGGSCGDASYLLPNIKYADLDSLVTELNSIYYSVSLNKEKENIEVYASNPRYDNMLFSTAIYQYINYGRKGFNFQYSYKNSNISEKLKKTVMQTYMSKNFMIKEIYNY